MGELGVIYPEGNQKDYSWRYVKIVDVPENEQSKYDGHVKRLDVENLQLLIVKITSYKLVRTWE